MIDLEAIRDRDRLLGQPQACDERGLDIARDRRALLAEVDRLDARWAEARRLLNEFRPVGNDDWVAVRLSALDFVLRNGQPQR